MEVHLLATVPDIVKIYLYILYRDKTHQTQINLITNYLNLENIKNLCFYWKL